MDRPFRVLLLLARLSKYYRDYSSSFVARVHDAATMQGRRSLSRFALPESYTIRGMHATMSSVSQKEKRPALTVLLDRSGNDTSCTTVPPDHSTTTSSAHATGPAALQMDQSADRHPQPVLRTSILPWRGHRWLVQSASGEQQHAASTTPTMVRF